MLGQYLLSRERITESELRAALTQQEESGRNLGAILIDAGRLSVEELERFLAAKVEESIYGIFDWEDGTFRFEPGAGPPADTIETNLSVEHVLLHGAARQDEMRRHQEVIGNDEAILEQTDAVLPDAVAASPVSRRRPRSINSPTKLDTGAEYVITQEPTGWRVNTKWTRSTTRQASPRRAG